MGVLGGSTIFRGAPQRSETMFVKPDGNSILKCGFRFSRRASEQGQLFDFPSKIEVLGPRFEKSRFVFGLIRGAALRFETTFVH